MDLYAYGGLFISAFAAATLLPAQSELVLSGLLVSGHLSTILLLAVATVGNVLGSIVNWLLGRYFHHCRDKSWFPIKGEALAKAERWYSKYGRWTLLLSWMPVIGDPVTLVAGLLKESFLSFLLLVSIAKFGRYLLLVAIVRQWL